MLNSAKKVFFVSLFTLSVLKGANSTWVPGGNADLANPNPPPSGDWNNGLPNVSSTDVGLFTGNGAPNPTLSTPLTLSNLTFDTTSPGYIFTLTSPANLTLTGNVINEGSGLDVFSLTGSELNLTGAVGTQVVASVISDSASHVTIDQNQLFGEMLGSGTVQLVNPSSELIYNGGLPIFTGVISGQGSVSIENGGRLTLTGQNTYSGGTTIGQFSQLTMQGTGSLNPSGSLTLEGSVSQFNLGTTTPTFTVGDLSASGGILSLNAQNFIFGTANSTTFAGDINGVGTLTKQGSGTFNLTGGFNSFEVMTDVRAGTFSLGSMTTLSGALNVFSGATLAGIGTANGAVDVMSGATVLPGSPGTPGTFNVNGSYTQASGSNYLVQINGGTSSSIAVIGPATLAGGEVIVQPDGSVLFNTPYTILSATGGVSGRFDGVTSTTLLLDPILIYPATGMSVLLELVPAFANGATTYNQRQVANQLESITSPDADQSALFAALYSLDPAGVAHAYDLLSGNQYTADPFAFSIVSREFIRRLYDPLRSIVTTLPCGRCYDPCGVDIWVEGGWDRAFLRNDGNGFGFSFTGWEVTAGIQKSFCDWTVGVAGAYEQDDLNYRLSGHGRMKTGFAGIYGLYRPDNFYVLADLAYGYNENHVTRPVSFSTFDGTAYSHPNLQDITFYIEGGFDVPMCSFLVQPFVGIESNSYWRCGFYEHGLADFDLYLYKTERTIALSRLGVHLTSDEIFCGVSISLDAAWDYQFTRPRNDFKAHFATFGDEFTIQGARIARNSFEGEVTLIKAITNSLTSYVEFSGQVWSQASSYSLVAGLQQTW